MVLGAFSLRRYRIVRRGGRCSRAPLRPHVGGDARRCHIGRRAALDCRRGAFGRAPFSYLEGVVLG